MANANLQTQDMQELVVQNMHRNFCKLHIKQTVGEALAAVRSDPPSARVIYFYVVDDNDALQGVIPTRRLLLSEADIPLADIMVRQVITIPHTATVLEACEFFVMHRLLAFPVVDEKRKILGVVDVELYTEELSDLDRTERNDDLFQMIGVHLAEWQHASSIGAYKSRFPWLLANIAGGLLAALLAGLYEGELQKVVALALFMPVVLALAESVAIQSVTLAIAMLHGQKATWKGLLVKVRREFLTGAMLGASCAAVVALTAIAWLGQPRFVAALFTGILCSVTCAALLGVMMPNVLRMMKRNPQVAAGPVALAMADMITLLIYFNLARWLLG